MARAITQRELRNESGQVMEAVDGGESFIVTRNGKPVAELRPIERRRFVSVLALRSTVQRLAAIDAERFFEDLDRDLDQRLRHG